MVELSGLESKFRVINVGRRLDQAFYLYRDPIFSIVYNIIRLYKNYIGWPRTLTHNWFSKTMLKLKNEVEYKFTIYQNLWI